MPYFKTITVRIGPKFLLSGAVFAFFVLIIGALAVLALEKLLTDNSFWKGANGMAVVVSIIVLLLCLTLLPALLLWFSEGQITIDSFGISWKMKKEKGEIVWKKPFTVKRWQSVIHMPIPGDGSANYSQDLPAIIYDITQENMRVAFYRGAGFDEVKGLPSAELYGIMLHRHAKKNHRHNRATV